MPVLSMFYGIIIRMYAEAEGKHHQPHIHAEYQGQEAVISLDGELISGDIKAEKLRMILVWMDIHHEELVANWTLLSNGERFFRIDPLK